MSESGERARLEQAEDCAVIEAISRGSVAAFTILFDRTSAPVRAELTAQLAGAPRPVGTARGEELLASSYLEVWWLAGCYARPGVRAVDWVRDIVRRRIASDSAAVRADDGGGEDTRPSHAELELAALLRRPVRQPTGR